MGGSGGVPGTKNCNFFGSHIWVPNWEMCCVVFLLKIDLIEDDIAKALDRSGKTKGKKHCQSEVLGHRVALAEVLAGVDAGDRGCVIPTDLQQIFPF